ncbi:gamma-glutamyltransferase [Paracoccus marcusii]|uniref:gamma-glutamyltransferase n=1 Tax=Paracoccus marcusii TaxID=59779 RepID=UPI002ED4CC4F|nr:gamma-glutamyltransferase [Paracoccus marcusii]
MGILDRLRIPATPQCGPICWSRRSSRPSWTAGVSPTRVTRGRHIGAAVPGSAGRQGGRDPRGSCTGLAAQGPAWGYGVLRRDGRAGRCASVLQSTYFDWGSGCVIGDTGIIWHNRGASFATHPTHPNVIGPGKRPFYTLNPGIALKDGRPHLLYGTQGADGQPQTLAVLLSGLVDLGLSPEAALAQPRFLLGRTFSDSRDSLKIEASLGDAAITSLAAMGRETAELPALSPIFGCAGAIRIDATGSSGAHDPRGEGWPSDAAIGRVVGINPPPMWGARYRWNEAPVPATGRAPCPRDGSPRQGDDAVPALPE